MSIANVRQWLCVAFSLVLPHAAICASPDHPPESQGARPLNAYEDIESFGSSSPFRVAARPVGLVYVKDSDDQEVSSCTGLLIGPRHILTARHCLESVDKNSKSITKLKPKSISFVLDSLKRGSGSEVAVEVVPMDIGDDSTDYLILHTKADVDLATRRTPKIGTDPKDLDDLYIIHHPFGRPLTLTRLKCKKYETPTVDGVFGHTCETEQISSGAPILDFNFQLVGIHLRGGRSEDPGTFNQGLLLSKILQKSKIAQEVLEKYGKGFSPMPTQASGDLGSRYRVKNEGDFYQKSGVWYITPESDPKISRRVHQQSTGAAELILWDSSSDQLYRFSIEGGAAARKKLADPAWNAIGRAEKVQ